MHDTGQTDCITAEGHDWAPTGLYLDGAPYRFCRRGQCAAGLKATVYGHVIKPDVFPASAGGIPMDIEDDPTGGVAKLVMREVVAAYGLDTLDLQPGDVVLDIGAHVGIVSCYLARRYPGIVVHAYEPLEANYRHLCRNVAANGVGETVQPHGQAVSGDGRLITLVFAPGTNSGGATMLLEPDGAHARQTAMSWTLAECVAEHIPSGGRCALLKLDCEGAEYEILRADPTVLDRVDRLVGEVHVNNRYSLDDANLLLHECAEHIPVERIRVTAMRMVDVAEAEAACPELALTHEGRSEGVPA